MVETTELSILELVGALRERRWTDVAIAKELGVSAKTVWCWRHGQGGVVRQSRPVRQALAALLDRP